MDPAHRSLLGSTEFRRLVRRRWRISLVLTGLLFALYYGYILLIALRPEILARRIGAVTTLGIPLGALVIIGSWVLTAAYIVWANREYDSEVARLRAQVSAFASEGRKQGDGSG